MMPRERLPSMALLLLGLMSAVALAGELPRSLTGPVVKIIDSDTIDGQLDGRPMPVHDIGVNAPGISSPRTGKEPCGAEATAENRRLVESRTVL